MYNLTGLPGWMRFGFSPGWIGRSPSGLGPAAHYMTYGTWPTPQMNSYWQQGQVPFPPDYPFSIPGFRTPYDPWGAAVISPEEELNMLRYEAESLDEQLEIIEQRIRELEGELK